MSYNVDNVQYVEGKLKIKRLDALILRENYKDNLPESNFLDGLDLKGDPEAILTIKDLWWSGEGSGTAYQEILFKLLEKTKGKAKIAFIWEGGDSISALEVDEGVIKECKAKIVLE